MRGVRERNYKRKEREKKRGGGAGEENIKHGNVMQSKIELM